MKILLASTSSGSRGGGELFLLYLGRVLRARGHEPALWCSKHSRMDELAALFAECGAVIRAEYVNTYDRRGRSIAGWLDKRTSRRVADEWRELRPDVIHLNKQNLEDGLDLLRAARLTRIPGVCTVHISHSARYLKAALAWPRDFISRRELLRYPGPMATSPESRARDLAEFLGGSTRARLVQNGVPIPDPAALAASRPKVRHELGAGDDTLLVVAVGRMVPQKRPLLFLEHAARIHRTIPRARFVWVGDGALSGEWDARVAALGLGDIVRRLPWQRDVPAFLSAADLFLHVAEFEGLPLAILEALGAGLPCAISANLLPDMPFLNAENSIAVDDGKEWVAALRDRAALRAIGRRARELALAKFSFERMAADYEALYRDAIGAMAS